MIAQRMNAANIAGIELAITLIRRQHSRIIERGKQVVDDVEYVKLSEIKNGYAKVLFIGPADMGVLFLAAFLDELEEE